MAPLKRRRWMWGIGAVAACALLLALAFSHPLLPRTAGLLISLATGTHTHFSDVRISHDRLVATGVEVRSRAGPEIFRAPSVELRYDLGAWRRRRFGLVDVALERPLFRLERLANGNWNIGAATGGGGAGAPGGVPLWFSMRVHDGTLQMRDPAHVLRTARSIDVRHIEIALTSDGAQRESAFTARAEVVDRGVAYPVTARGSLSYARGDAIQHWHIAHMPIADLGDFFIASPSVQLASGMISDLDATLFAVGLTPGGTPAYHLAGSAQLRDGAISVAALRQPVAGVRGRVLLFDSGFLARSLRGEIGGTPIDVEGGIFGLLGAKPQLDLSVQSSENLAHLRELFNFSGEVPLGGRARIAVRVVGGTDDPLIVTQIAVPQAHYDTLPLRDLHGRVIYYHDAVTFAPLLGEYGPISLALGGSLALGEHVVTDAALDAVAPTARLPYLAQIAANPRIEGAIRVSGNDLTFAGDAFLRGLGTGGSTFAAVSYDAQRLLIAPLHAVRPDGSVLWTGAQIEQRGHRLAMWSTAHGAVIHNPLRPVTLPGLELPQLPPLGARLDARVAMEGKLSDLAMGGSVGVRDLQIGPLSIAQAGADLAGSGTRIAVYNGSVRGRWGSARLTGGFDALHDVLALHGPYRADLAGARPLLADTPARGTAGGTLSVVLRPQRTLVQLEGRAIGTDLVRGVPVTRGFATLGVDDRGANVYAAGATIAGGTAVAAGRFAPAGALDVTARDVQLARLKGLGVPLDSGRLLLVGRAHPGRAGALDFDGGMALVGSSLFGEDASGSARLAMTGDRVTLESASGAYDGTWAGASGTVVGVGLRTPRLDLAVDVRALDVAPWLRRLGYGSLYGEGNVAARLRLMGSASDPHVDGTVRMDVGSVHGMEFTDLTTHVDASPHSAALDSGTVMVGGSHLRFDARLADGTPGFAVAGRAIDLADFNDWFDEFDTLGGKGTVDLAASGFGVDLSGHANVALQGVRVRTLPFGNVHTAVEAKRSGMSGVIDLGDAALGTLVLRGSATLPRGAFTSPLAYAERIDSHVHGKLSSFDLARWLPALGIYVPLAGAVDADMQLDGRYPKARLIGAAQLRNGVAEKLSIDRLALSLDSNFITTRISDADLELQNVSATAAGRIGPAGHLALGVHLRTPSVRRVVYDLLKRPLDVEASGEADLRIGGTVARPALSGGFDLAGGSFGHLPFEEAFGQLSLQGRYLELSDGELRLPKGTVSLAGRLPLELYPLQLGPPSSSLGLNLTVDGADLSDLSGFLPAQSELGGRVDGRLAVAGTLADPLVVGQVALRDGRFMAPFERAPVTGAEATLTLAGRRVSVDRLRAQVGGGSVEGNGTLEITPGPAGATLTYDARLRARRARLDVPTLGQGTLDAGLTLAATNAKQPTLSGDITLSNASLSLSGLYGIATKGVGAGAFASSTPFGLGLDLHVSAAKNVRVQGSVLDIGATGSMGVTGTLADPKLAASFQSTNGTISYFDRLFRVDRATLSFDPESGAIPYITATASTRITNVSPSVPVTLHAVGPVTNLTVDFSSDRPYDRQQLLALLLDVPAFTGQSLTPGQGDVNPATQPGGALPGLRGAPGIPNAPLPPGVLVPAQNGGFDVSGEALSILNAQFGRALLAPLGGALGLQDLGLALEHGGAVAIDVSKALTDRVSLNYRESLSIPTRQSVGFDYFPSENTSLNLQVFQQGASSLQNQLTSNATNLNVRPGEPIVGTQGWALSIRRLFP
ncbi:hypothetical protein EPN44_02210 [bacterium]|nr:MAG: hypothetical protein EPN44_02210 [bacterium]